MGLLPALPGLQAAVAERPIMAASTFRATGIPVWDQAGQGDRSSRGSLHTYGFINTNQLTNQLRKEGPHSRRGRPLLSVRFE